MVDLMDPLTLPGGAVIPNRVAKAAMQEQLAAAGQVPGDRLATLYRAWAAGGAGLIITGNVMVDARAVSQPADVVLEVATPLDGFRTWAQAARSGGALALVQLNHPGRVVQGDLAEQTWSASAVPILAGRFSSMYPVPRPMTDQHLRETVDRFATAAARAREAGFDGVEVHAAHGYLISQFLSPLTNRRTDRWGGDLRSRARLLLEVVRAVRAAAPPPFAVAVKLNSADFQRGGFDADDARAVVQMLGDAQVDLVELSGGSIESMAVAGAPADGSTLAREAYFLDVAEQIIATSPVPVMLTGGIRRHRVAQRVLDGGVAVVGIGTALAMDPQLPQRWRRGTRADVAVHPVRWRSKLLAAAAAEAVVSTQMLALSRGRTPTKPLPPALALVLTRTRRTLARRRYRALVSTRRNAS